jgi:hypothetical protein
MSHQVMSVRVEGHKIVAELKLDKKQMHSLVKRMPTQMEVQIVTDIPVDAALALLDTDEGNFSLMERWYDRILLLSVDG